MNVATMLMAGSIGLMSVLLLVPVLRALTARNNRAGVAREFHQTHRLAVPRLGGVALAVAFLAVVITVMLVAPGDAEKARLRFIMAGGTLAMFAVGFWDDLRPLGARRKLAAQILIALAVYGLGIRIDKVSNPFGAGAFDLGAWGALATVLWLVAMTNLVNLIDGIDGLAAGICLMLMGLLVYVQHSMDSFPLLACGMTGALIGFLYYNFPPARIYMGDGGAYMLGFLIGQLTIVSSHKGTVIGALIAPLFVLALPIIDMSLAILRRGLRGLPLFRPDRGHIHHRLLEMGLTRRSAVLAMYSFTLVFLLLGFVAFGSRGRWLPVLAGAGLLVVLLAAGRLSFARKWFAVGEVIGNSLRMREETAYAMSLTRWLVMEARRVRSVDEFWNLFVFAAERLGFSRVQLKLADSDREWRRAGDEGASHQSEGFDFQASGAGVIKFEAAISPPPAGGQPPTRAQNGDRTGPCAGDERTFYVLSELMAEAWLEASRLLRSDPAVAMRFARAPAPAPLPGGATSVSTEQMESRLSGGA